jgi:hypothetical protein
MADSKRVSGRQIPSGTSGRAPATSTSGRAAAQPSGTSGRAAAQPSHTSGRAAPSGVSPSGRMTASGSGRGAAASAPAPVSRAKITAAAPRASARTTRRDQAGGVGKPKKTRGVGGALMVCFGALGFMGLVAGVIFVTKNSEKKKVENAKNEEQEKYENNIKLGFDYFAKAETAGLLYCMGTDKDINEKEKMRDKLFAAFKGDDKVYNVLFERRYKDKKAKEKSDQEFLFPERNRIERTEKGEMKNEVRVVYGFADGKTIPLVVGSKNIKPTEGDQANLGGSITIMVKAQEDHIFKTTRDAKPKNAVESAPATEKAPEPAK